MIQFPLNSEFYVAPYSYFHICFHELTLAWFLGYTGNYDFMFNSWFSRNYKPKYLVKILTIFQKLQVKYKYKTTEFNLKNLIKLHTITLNKGFISYKSGFIWNVIFWKRKNKYFCPHTSHACMSLIFIFTFNSHSGLISLLQLWLCILIWFLCSSLKCVHQGGVGYIIYFQASHSLQSLSTD